MNRVLHRSKNPLAIVCFSFILASSAALFAGSVFGDDLILAEQLFAAGKYAEAAVEYQQLAAKDPGNPGLWTRLGDCQYRLRRYEESEKNFRQALTAASDFRPAFVGLGKTLIVFRRLQEA